MDSAVIINNLVNNLEEPCGQCCYYQQLGLRAGTNQEGCQGNGKCRTHAYQHSVSASKASNTLSQMARNRLCCLYFYFKKRRHLYNWPFLWLPPQILTHLAHELFTFLGTSNLVKLRKSILHRPFQAEVLKQLGFDVEIHKVIPFFFVYQQN